MAEEQKTVFNKDVLFLVDMLDRYIVEVNRSQSSGVSGMLPFDITRIRSYTGAITSFHDWANSVPVGDYPETHPRQFPLEPRPETTNVESESVNMIGREFEAMRWELINSQSARLANTLMVHDSQRLRTYVARVESFLTDYVETQTPIDLPESSPEEKMAPAGFHGVNP